MATTETLDSPVDGGAEDGAQVCPFCGGWGGAWEGGMSINPEIDNYTPCPHCRPDE